ncbi:MAG TPA: hypothetical protein VNI57_00480, partial [Candidatus Saccharimonadales bacterium]|nr:hypothetical protein [Candidatus Saccharimonadales bacterium]
VGIFGGSFAEGLWREGREALIEELRRWKPWADRGIVVEPVALGGYKQPQQLMSLAWFLSIGARFDAVVNLDGFNEVALAPAENAGEVYPFYPRGWPARVSNFIDPRRLSLVARMDALEKRQKSLARVFSRFPLSWSMTANLVWRSLQVRVSAGRAALSQELERYAASRKGKLGYLASGPPARYPDDHAMYEALAATWARSSREMHDLAAARGILYLHDLQPNQYVEGSKPMSRREREAAWQEDHPYRKGVVEGYPLLAANGEELRREGIEFHDLTGIFRDHPEPLYVDSCCHVSREGYEIVAREIGRELVALAGSGR